MVLRRRHEVHGLESSDGPQTNHSTSWNDQYHELNEVPFRQCVAFLDSLKFGKGAEDSLKVEYGSRSLMYESLLG